MDMNEWPKAVSLAVWVKWPFILLRLSNQP